MDKDMNNATMSPGLNFLSTALDSMPKGVGDRVRSGVMADFLSGAIKTGMIFNRKDGQALKSLGFRTCVGVFDALSLNFYTLACREGGTYAAMWEEAHATKPWKASLLLNTLKPGRVAPGIAFLINEADTETGLARSNGCQVWHCTSMQQDKIVFCRYLARDRLYGETPVKRKSLNRAEWETLQGATQLPAKT